MRVGFGFSSVNIRSRIFHSRVFNNPSVDTDEQSSWKVPAFFLPNIQIVVTNSLCWQCLYTLISLVNKQLLQYTLLKSFTVWSAVLTEFAQKFYTQLLYQLSFSQNCPRNTFALTRLCFIWVSRAIAKHARIDLSAFVDVQASLWTALATCSWYTTRREHVTKSAPARRRHSVGGGVAAAAHSSSFNHFILETKSHNI